MVRIAAWRYYLNMAITLIEKNGGRILEAHAGEKLTEADYQQLVPRFEALLRQHGKLRLLFDMSGFHGWEAKALWEDIKFDAKHFNDLERIAMVGDKKWQEWSAKVDVLKARAEKAGADAKLKYHEQLQQAEHRQEEVRKKFAALKDASGNAWLNLKAGVDSAMDQLHAALSEK